MSGAKIQVYTRYGTPSIANPEYVVGATPPTVDGNIALWDGTTGRLLKSTTANIDGSGIMTNVFLPLSWLQVDAAAPNRFLTRDGSGTVVDTANPSLANLLHDHSNAANGGTLPASSIGSGQLALARGGTGADLSATGGANQIVRQNSSGGAFTVSALAAGDIPNLDAAKVTSGTFDLARLPAIPYVKVVDQQAKGTHGGASTNATWHTRVLNTEVQDTGAIASVASNQVTLPAGTYDIRILAPAYSPTAHVVVLRNDTDGAIALFGANYYANNTNLGSNNAEAFGRVTIAGSKAFSIRHYVVTGAATFGLGVALNINDPDGANRSEIYAVFEAWKVA